MNRRDMLLALAAGGSAALLGCRAARARSWGKNRTGLGVCIYCLGIRIRAQKRPDGLADPLHFLEHCGRLGAGGIQVPLRVQDEASAARLRQRAEELEMFLEGITKLPRKASDMERFEAEVRTAKWAGASVMRVVLIPGKRYEKFDSLAAFQKAADAGRKSLEQMEKIAARAGIRLAVENHQDQRVPELLGVIKHIDSEYVGICVDIANSFALLEDPVEVVKAYAPWAYAVHVKDVALQEAPEGFSMADVPLGKGFLELETMLAILRKAKPKIRFCLEVITHDPHEVPCLSEKYWKTLGDVPARDLARTLATVRAHSAATLPRVSDLPVEQQIQLEASNVEQCLAYARERLRM